MKNNCKQITILVEETSNISAKDKSLLIIASLGAATASSQQRCKSLLVSSSLGALRARIATLAALNLPGPVQLEHFQWLWHPWALWPTLTNYRFRKTHQLMVESSMVVDARNPSSL